MIQVDRENFSIAIRVEKLQSHYLQGIQNGLSTLVK